MEFRCAEENRKLREHLDTLRSFANNDIVQSALYSILGSTPDAVFVKDLEGRYLWINEAGARIAGRPVSSFIGSRDVEIFGPVDGQRFREMDQRAVREETVVVEQEHVIDIEGREFYMLSHKGPFRNALGEIVGTFGVSRDISEHVLTSDALKRERDSRVLAEEAAGIGVWDFDRALGRDYASPEYLKMLGLPVSDDLFRPDVFWARVHPDDHAAAMADWGEVLRRHVNSVTVAYRLLLPDDVLRWVKAVSRLEYGANGECVRWYGTLVDVSDQHMAHEHLQKLVRERTEELDRALAQVRQGEAHYRYLFGAIEDGILVHDADGRILDCNDGICEALGYSRAELLSMGTYDIDEPSFAASFSNRLSEQLDKGRFRGEGLVGFVQKPYRAAQLRQTVFKALSGTDHIQIMA